MSKSWIWILAIVVVLFVLTVAVDNRIAAGGGALLLFGAIIYGYTRNKGASQAEIARAERGAHEVREDIAEDEERRGER